MGKKTRVAKEFEIAVKLRAGGMCEWCHAEGKPVIGTAAHHIWPKSTARKPSKWDQNQLLPGLENWPHVELNGILLCVGCHAGAHGTAGKAKRGAGPGIRISRPAFYRLLDAVYAKRVFNGMAYAEWFAKSGPWETYL